MKKSKTSIIDQDLKKMESKWEYIFNNLIFKGVNNFIL